MNGYSSVSTMPTSISETVPIDGQNQLGGRPKMKNWTQILDNYALNGENPNTEKEKKH